MEQGWILCGGSGEVSLPQSKKSEAKESRQGHPQRREPKTLAGMKRQDFKRLKEGVHMRGKPKMSEPKHR